MDATKLNKLVDEMCEMVISDNHNVTRSKKMLANELGLTLHSLYNLLRREQDCSNQLAAAVTMFNYILSTNQYDDYLRFKIKQNRKRK